MEIDLTTYPLLGFSYLLCANLLWVHIEWTAAHLFSFETLWNARSRFVCWSYRTRSSVPRPWKISPKNITIFQIFRQKYNSQQIQITYEFRLIKITQATYCLYFLFFHFSRYFMILSGIFQHVRIVRPMYNRRQNPKKPAVIYFNKRMQGIFLQRKTTTTIKLRKIRYVNSQLQSRIILNLTTVFWNLKTNLLFNVVKFSFMEFYNNSWTYPILLLIWKPNSCCEYHKYC